MSPNPVEVAADITELLNTYGPWAVMALTIVIAAIIIWYIGKRMNKQLEDYDRTITGLNEVIASKDELINQKDKTLLDTLEARHNQFTAVLTETTNALAIASNTNKRLIQLLEQVSRQYDRVQDRLDRSGQGE